MHLASITLTRTLPCLDEPGMLIVVGRPDRSLGLVLPYLATLPGVIAYKPEACTLAFRLRPGFLTLYTDKVYITQVKDVSEGLELLAAVKDAVNASWEERFALQPVTTRRRAPRPLDVYAQLPQTTCKRCGEATCMAFAFGLIQGGRSPAECPPLVHEEAHFDRRATLEAML